MSSVKSRPRTWFAEGIDASRVCRGRPPAGAGGAGLAIGGASGYTGSWRAATVRGALRAILDAASDVVLCHYQLPDGSGLDLTRHLLKHDPAIRILIVPMVDGGPVPRQPLACRCDGLRVEGARRQRGRARGARGSRWPGYLNEGLGARVLFETTPFDRLSPRHLEVALLMVQGRRNADIALELDLTESTIRTVRAKVMANRACRRTSRWRGWRWTAG